MQMCQSLMDDWWRGGYPGSLMRLKEGEGDLRRWMYVVLPLINPYLYAADKKRSIEDFGMGAVAGITEAVLHTYRLAKAEIVRSGGVLPESQPPRLASIMNAAEAALAKENKRIAEATANADRKVGDANASGLFSGSMRNFYSVPTIKMLVRLTLHLVYLFT